MKVQRNPGSSEGGSSTQPVRRRKRPTLPEREGAGWFIMTQASYVHDFQHGLCLMSGLMPSMHLLITLTRRIIHINDDHEGHKLLYA